MEASGDCPTHTNAALRRLGPMLRTAPPVDTNTLLPHVRHSPREFGKGRLKTRFQSRHAANLLGRTGAEPLFEDPFNLKGAERRKLSRGGKHCIKNSSLANESRPDSPPA